MVVSIARTLTQGGSPSRHGPVSGCQRPTRTSRKIDQWSWSPQPGDGGFYNAWSPASYADWTIERETAWALVGGLRLGLDLVDL